MTIKILPTQLANQIAAGEVVERPASVVKELVENSLDAGATEITIEIEQAGSQLIRIRDNGCGIRKEELHLALTPHATSKISTLADLEAILTMGFRGEALASISSVSRLSLTSKTAEQAEAWQIQTSGRESDTQIKPAAHPVGTTIEIATLFFNTPARKKFLRSEKTEFAHIDETIRRIALAKPNISFSLKHDNKIVRKYRASLTEEQKIARLANICGAEFVANSLQINYQHDDLNVYGWIGLANLQQNQNNLAYCYVNGRVIRDKTINHAIRQAYGESLKPDTYPQYVLFIDIDPTQVDVNVHPTKHEIRFHQARLVHDFIFHALYSALQQTDELIYSEPLISEHENQLIPNITPNREAAGRNIFSSPSGYKHQINENAVNAYHRLIQNEADNDIEQCSVGTPITRNSIQTNANNNQHLQLLTVVKNMVLFQRDTGLYFTTVPQLQQLNAKQQLIANVQQPLLIPLSLKLVNPLIWQQQKDFFAAVGFSITEQKLAQDNYKIKINAVPSILREQNIQKIVLQLLKQKDIANLAQFITYLEQQITFASDLVSADILNLLMNIEQNENNQLENILIPLDLDKYLTRCIN